MTIAHELGARNSAIIAKIMRQNGIKARSDREQALRFHCNSHYFDEIDTPEKAYWFGFLCADGYITRPHSLGISIHTNDREHLEQFRNDIAYDGHISNYTVNKGGYTNTPYSRILISDPHLTEALINHGCIKHKSLQLQFPTEEHVPKDLQWHFVRGYFDGDGSLTYLSHNQHKLSITSTQEMLTGILNLWGVSHLKLYRKPQHKERDINSYSLCVGGNQQVYRILQSLYQDATRYLLRKYQKYQDFLQFYSENCRAS